MTPTSSKLNAQFNEHICQHHITSRNITYQLFNWFNAAVESVPSWSAEIHFETQTSKRIRQSRPNASAHGITGISNCDSYHSYHSYHSFSIWHILPWQAMLSSHVQRSQSTVPGKGPEVTHGSAHRWRSWQHCFCLLMSFDVFWSFDSVGLCWGYVGLQLISVSAAPSFGSNSCHSTLLDQPPQLQHVLTRQVTL